MEAQKANSCCCAAHVFTHVSLVPPLQSVMSQQVTAEGKHLL